MNFKKNIGFIILLTLLEIGCAVAAVYAFLMFQKESVIGDELVSAREQYQRLTGRTPYPSSANVDIMRDNLDELNQLSRSWIDELVAQQVEPMYLERAEFPPLVEGKMTELWDSAAQNKVGLPVDFAFGFKEYIEGAVPLTNDIPRLTVQLETIYELGQMLFDAKISKLINIEREVFEKEKRKAAAPEKKRRRRRPDPKEDDKRVEGEFASETELYVAERYKISFEARDNAVWNVLNAFSRSSLFIVIHSIELNSELSPHTPISFDKLREEKMRAMGGVNVKNAAMMKIDLPDRDARVVSGREPVSVVADVIVYRFKKADEEKNASGEQS